MGEGCSVGLGEGAGVLTLQVRCVTAYWGREMPCHSHWGTVLCKVTGVIVSLPSSLPHMPAHVVNTPSGQALGLMLGNRADIVPVFILPSPPLGVSSLLLSLPLSASSAFPYLL